MMDTASTTKYFNKDKNILPKSSSRKKSSVSNAEKTRFVSLQQNNYALAQMLNKERHEKAKLDHLRSVESSYSILKHKYNSHVNQTQKILNMLNERVRLGVKQVAGGLDILIDTMQLIEQQKGQISSLHQIEGINQVLDATPIMSKTLKVNPMVYGHILKKARIPLQRLIMAEPPVLNVIEEVQDLNNVPVNESSVNADAGNYVLLNEAERGPNHSVLNGYTTNHSSLTRGASNRSSLNVGAPNRLSLNGGAPNRLSLNGGAPNHSSLNGGTPDHSSLNVVAPTSLNGGAPNLSSLNGGAPNLSSSNGSAPNLSSLNGSAPNPSSLSGGASNHSSLIGNAPNHSSLNEGAPNHLSSTGRTQNHSSLKGGAPNHSSSNEDVANGSFLGGNSVNPLLMNNDGSGTKHKLFRPNETNYSTLHSDGPKHMFSTYTGRHSLVKDNQITQSSLNGDESLMPNANRSPESSECAVDSDEDISIVRKIVTYPTVCLERLKDLSEVSRENQPSKILHRRSKDLISSLDNPSDPKIPFVSLENCVIKEVGACAISKQRYKNKRASNYFSVVTNETNKCMSPVVSLKDIGKVAFPVSVGGYSWDPNVSALRSRTPLLSLENCASSMIDVRSISKLSSENNSGVSVLSQEINSKLTPVVELQDIAKSNIFSSSIDQQKRVKSEQQTVCVDSVPLTNQSKKRGRQKQKLRILPSVVDKVSSTDQQKDKDVQKQKVTILTSNVDIVPSIHNLEEKDLLRSLDNVSAIDHQNDESIQQLEESMSFGTDGFSPNDCKKWKSDQSPKEKTLTSGVGVFFSDCQKGKDVQKIVSSSLTSVSPEPNEREQKVLPSVIDEMNHEQQKGTGVHQPCQEEATALFLVDDFKKESFSEKPMETKLEDCTSQKQPDPYEQDPLEGTSWKYDYLNLNCNSSPSNNRAKQINAKRKHLGLHNLQLRPEYSSSDDDDSFWEQPSSRRKKMKVTKATKAKWASKSYQRRKSKNAVQDTVSVCRNKTEKDEYKPEQVRYLLRSRNFKSLQLEGEKERRSKKFYGRKMKKM